MASALNWLDKQFVTSDDTITEDGTGELDDVESLTADGDPAAIIRFTGATPTLNGIADGDSGRRLGRLVVMAIGDDLVLANESTSSSAANRIVTGTGGDVTVPEGASAELAYDEAALRWRLVGSIGGSGSFTAGGDLTGTSSSQTVAKVKGTAIGTAGGSLATGKVLRVTGVASADWGAVDLADADAVTGALPQAHGGAGTDLSAVSGILKNTAGVLTGVAAPSGTIVGTSDTQALSGKTIDGAFNTLTVRIANDVAGLGAGVATFLATPSSTNLAAAVTNETGSGALVFGTNPTLSSPTIDSPEISGHPLFSGSQSSTTNDSKGTATEVNPVNVQTTDATVTTLDTIDLGVTSLTGAILATWLVTATKSDGSEAAAYSVTALFRAASSSSLTQVGSTTTTVIAESDAAWDATADVSGGDARLRVTGKAATTIRWTSILTKLRVIP